MSLKELELILKDVNSRNNVSNYSSTGIGKFAFGHLAYTETSAFLRRSILSLLAINTSASSRRRTHPHLCAIWKQRSKFFSTVSAVSPISPHVIENSGLPVCSATHSAVEVLPIIFSSLDSALAEETNWIGRSLTDSGRTVKENDDSCSFSLHQINIMVDFCRWLFLLFLEMCLKNVFQLKKGIISHKSQLRRSFFCGISHRLALNCS